MDGKFFIKKCKFFIHRRVWCLLSLFIIKIHTWKIISNDNIEQVALSSHSTSLIDNEILRPDCYFVLNDKGKIKQFSEITDKKIEEYHNIEKMYRTEVFEYE